MNCRDPDPYTVEPSADQDPSYNETKLGFTSKKQKTRYGHQLLKYLFQVAKICMLLPCPVSEAG